MRAHALRALELDPDSVEGLTALGAWAAFHDWRLEEGEQHFLRALRLSPNSSKTFGWYGQLLENTGRQAENLVSGSALSSSIRSRSPGAPRSVKRSI